MKYVVVRSVECRMQWPVYASGGSVTRQWGAAKQVKQVGWVWRVTCDAETSGPTTSEGMGVRSDIRAHGQFRSWL
jgi:hypothetical protein